MIPPQLKIVSARIFVILCLAMLVQGLTACSYLFLPKRVAVAGKSLCINMDNVDVNNIQSVYVVSFDGDRVFLESNPSFAICFNIYQVKHRDETTVDLKILGASEHKSSDIVYSDFHQSEAQVVFQAHDEAGGKYSTPENNVRAFERRSDYFVNSLRIELDPNELELLSSRGNLYALLEDSSECKLIFQLEHGNGILGYKQLRTVSPIQWIAFVLGLLLFIIVLIIVTALASFFKRKLAEFRKLHSAKSK